DAQGTCGDPQSTHGWLDRGHAIGIPARCRPHGATLTSYPAGTCSRCAYAPFKTVYYGWERLSDRSQPAYRRGARPRLTTLEVKVNTVKHRLWTDINDR